MLQLYQSSFPGKGNGLGCIQTSTYNVSVLNRSLSEAVARALPGDHTELQNDPVLLWSFTGNAKLAARASLGALAGYTNHTILHVKTTGAHMHV